MALSLPFTLVAGTPQNVTQVQSNFDAISNSFPLAINTTNFSQVPQVHAYHSATQTVVGTAAYVTMALNSERYDLGTPSTNMHDTVTNNSRLTCRVAGLYSIAGNICITMATSPGVILTQINLNAGTVIGHQDWYLGPVGGNPVAYCIAISTQYRLAVNDYVELQIAQGSGITQNVISADAAGPDFMMHWVSP